MAQGAVIYGEAGEEIVLYDAGPGVSFLVGAGVDGGIERVQHGHAHGAGLLGRHFPAPVAVVIRGVGHADELHAFRLEENEGGPGVELDRVQAEGGEVRGRAAGLVVAGYVDDAAAGLVQGE